MMDSQSSSQSSKTAGGLGRAQEGVADTVIVSVFGRGNWLATELATRGWKVTLVDVSERMGPWDTEDSEGPFGLFESADLLASQKSAFEQEGERVELPQGFVLWPPSGPIEFRGGMTSFQLERFKGKGITESAEKYLRHAGLPTKESDRDRRALSKRPFEEVWLAHFAHQLTSNQHRENHVALSSEMPAPVFAAYGLRRLTKDSSEKSLRACQAAGVTVRAKAGVRDARASGKIVDVIEIEDERSGVLRGRSFVWMLSSAETEKLGVHLRDVLYPRGSVEPEWFWARYGLTLQGVMDGVVRADQIPTYAVLVEDVLLPWTHSNMLVLRKRSDDAREVDVWAKVPNWARFDKDYLSKVGEEIRLRVSARLPQAGAALTLLPLEARTKREFAGPPRFPVFSEQALDNLQPLKSSNLFFDGPEMGASLDALGQYRRQTVLFQQLEKLKAQWDEEAARKAPPSTDGRSVSP